MFQIKRFLVPFIGCIIAASCLDEPECVRINNNVAGFLLKTPGTNESKSVRFLEVSILGIDSLFIERKNVKSVIIPLNYFSTETSIRFVRPGDVIDTVTIGYKVQTQFISEDCGERYYLSSLEVVHHTFDSIRVISNLPGKDNKAKNFEIFFDE